MLEITNILEVYFQSVFKVYFRYTWSILWMYFKCASSKSEIYFKYTSAYWTALSLCYFDKRSKFEALLILWNSITILMLITWSILQVYFKYT